MGNLWATVTAYTVFDMSNPTTWFGTVVAATSNLVKVSYGSTVADEDRGGQCAAIQGDGKYIAACSYLISDSLN